MIFRLGGVWMRRCGLLMRFNLRISTARYVFTAFFVLLIGSQ